MSLDPFRVQVLTLALDSQAVLTLVGVVAAGFVFRAVGREAGRDLSLDLWWEVLLGAVVGARLLWVGTHLAYYLRSPQQVLVLTDGGLPAPGLVAGAALALWRLARRGGQTDRRALVAAASMAFLTALLFERVGCALTTCGDGPVAGVPWAMLRGDTWRQPIALLQVLVLSAALLLLAGWRWPWPARAVAPLLAWATAEAVAIAVGASAVDALLTPLLALALLVLTRRHAAGATHPA